jgi:hypothetical protein
MFNACCVASGLVKFIAIPPSLLFGKYCLSDKTIFLRCILHPNKKNNSPEFDYLFSDTEQV